MAAAAFGQQKAPQPSGYFHMHRSDRKGGELYGYGCDPCIPLLVTPEIYFQTVSPNPVGASNATWGLVAGATNSTLSETQGWAITDDTEAVWYRGGAPLVTPQVHLWPETIGGEGGMMHGAMPDGMREERMREERFREEHPGEMRPREARAREERGPRHSEEARGDWAFITSPAPSGAHVYNNDDVTRQNGKNGTVKFDGKTEKM
jgi:hypothetical protein